MDTVAASPGFILISCTVSLLQFTVFKSMMRVSLPHAEKLTHVGKYYTGNKTAYFLH